MYQWYREHLILVLRQWYKGRHQYQARLLLGKHRALLTTHHLLLQPAFMGRVRTPLTKRNPFIIRNPQFMDRNRSPFIIHILLFMGQSHNLLITTSLLITNHGRNSMRHTPVVLLRSGSLLLS